MVDKGFSSILGSRSYCVNIFMADPPHLLPLLPYGTPWPCRSLAFFPTFSPILHLTHIFTHTQIFYSFCFFWHHTHYLCFPFLSKKYLKSHHLFCSLLKQISIKRLQTFCSFSGEIHWRVSGRGVRDCA